MTNFLDTHNHARVNERTTKRAMESKPRDHEPESNECKTEIILSSGKASQSPVNIEDSLTASSENSGESIADPNSAYLHPTWSNCNSNKWETPHVHEQQKYTWYCSTLGMDAKRVHDEWGFSSANLCLYAISVEVCASRKPGAASKSVFLLRSWEVKPSAKSQRFREALSAAKPCVFGATQYGVTATPTHMFSCSVTGGIACSKAHRTSSAPPPPRSSILPVFSLQTAGRRPKESHET
ncbi:hypothetical protein DE146DRAFT_628323 [Phaeosphaeria sp. MPI-PUGE-AT-0046c]|nr:hypothetical protein DE146DRAFT_628323 [Phaeosphaeria sp. MPI-PUGE-AT-0046c]